MNVLCVINIYTFKYIDIYTYILTNVYIYITKTLQEYKTSSFKVHKLYIECMFTKNKQKNKNCILHFYNKTRHYCHQFEHKFIEINILIENIHIYKMHFKAK